MPGKKPDERGDYPGYLRREAQPVLDPERGPGAGPGRAAGPGLQRQAHAQAGAWPPGLGYRGFIISNPGGRTGLPLACRVFGGTINIREKGVTDPSQVYAIEDRNRIESWLLEQAAQKNLDQDIAAWVGREP